ncbi:hypothetical protein B0O80DRAFT_129823 [Mortierella sp. GBAus27b]|nr:hypothetical protein B0O80DRAFT_129823 [Mortierella sp. GBAus27b]
MILFIPQESSNTASPSTSTSSPPDRSPVAKPEPSKGTGSSSKRKSGLVDIKPSISGESSTAIRSDIASSRNGSPREFTDYPEGTADGIDSESDDSDDMRQRNEAALAMAALHQPQSLYGSRPQTSTSPSPSYQYPRSGDYYHSQTTFSDSSPDVHRPRSPYSSNAPGFSYYSKPTAGTQEHPRDYSRPGGYGRIDAEPHPNGRTSWAPDTESHPRDNRYHPEGQHSRESMGNHDESRSV